ncbi:MAG: SDR family NAD(P)-dependent oxidoreductase, partial [Hyphomonadaceae bacterium]
DPVGTGEIEKARDSGLPITIIPFDVTDEAGAEPLVARVVKDSGRIDALVNNAGVSMFAAFEDVSEADTRRMFEINFFGPVRLMLAALPYMRKQQFGRIVNVSSGAGFMPMAWQSTYVATKHAIDGITISLGAEVRRFGIRTSVVSPGVFATGIGGKLWPPSRDSGEPWYREMTESIINDWKTIVTGRDPIAVAQAINECIHSDTPPTRTFVGKDAQRGAEARRKLNDDEWAEFLLQPLFKKRPS